MAHGVDIAVSSSGVPAGQPGYAALSPSAFQQLGRVDEASMDPVGTIGASGRRSVGQASAQFLSAAATRRWDVPPQGRVISQGDHAMGTDMARIRDQVDGTGLKIGIISDSFNLKTQMGADIANGELPTDTKIVTEGVRGNDEGRAMAQIIHDVAPGASIEFVAASQTSTEIHDMANAILQLAADGAKIIVDDWMIRDETTYQDSEITQAIQKVVSEGVVYVTAAGNNSNRGYEAAFNAAAGPVTIGSNTVILHQFAPGQDYIPVTIGANSSVSFRLQWDDPAASVSPGHGAQSNLDVLVYDDQNNLLFAAAQQNIGGDPLESFFLTTQGSPVTFHIKVALNGGPPPSDFKLMALDENAPVQFGALASNTNAGTIFGHMGSDAAITVGAVNYQDTPAFGAAAPTSEPFSSTGTSLVTYGVDGQRLATPRVQPGVTVSGPDGGDNTFFGTDTDGDGLPNFLGTSAAAPHVAGLTALMLQADPALSPTDVKSLLQDSAIPMTDRYNPGAPAGSNPTAGAGLVQGTAVDFAATGVIENDQAQKLTGTHLDDTIVGGMSGQVLTGGGGDDVFQASAAQLNSDVITDFSINDALVIRDTTTFGFRFNFNAATGALDYSPDAGMSSYHLTLNTGGDGQLVASAAPTGGVLLRLVG
ncbi:S8 family serine peptidase [Nitrospirillum sp. BR 11828]|uniref:S8 family serine peptidase n=1 Tax=Nitrospirillum sp. BR 11828 TaxID=3104325 RepID=UPI002ACA5F30|nr:S8 family serine peptidase [Nitrospirillum sp. BR 11828]MDZ5649079.1 S8 family serine peptidase [Nitrospirillum sp. BR 11828]